MLEKPDPFPPSHFSLHYCECTGTEINFGFREINEGLKAAVVDRKIKEHMMYLK